MPAASRSPAQIEAARRNGARSRGPATPEGKARSRLNALRHGMAARGHLLVEGEDPAAFEALFAGLVEDLEPATELEARLVHRLAVAFWKSDRADRIEAAAFAATPRPRHLGPNGYFDGDPESKVPLDRLNAVRLYAAQAGREASRVLRELRLLREARAANPENEPEREGAATLDPPNEPGGGSLLFVTPREGGGSRVAATGPSPENEPEPRPMNRQQRRRLAALRRRRAA